MYQISISKAKISLFVLLTVIIMGGMANAGSFNDDFQEQIRNRLEVSGIPLRMVLDEDIIHASEALPLFYERRGYFPAWIEDGTIRNIVDSLIVSVEAAEIEGLNPGDYHLEKIKALLSRIKSKSPSSDGGKTKNLLNLEFLCTDALLIYSTHLLRGKVDARSIDSEWRANSRERDMPEFLEQTIKNGKIAASLQTILPNNTGYNKLKSALKKYREIQAKGGWPVISEGPTLRLDDQDSRVRQLRQRLTFSGDLQVQESENPEYFDSAVYKAVAKFQTRHGLDVDGKVGPVTLAALNVPVEKRIDQIRVNLERWRWLPEKFGDKFLIVNIANYELDYFEHDNLKMTMRAIVGRPYRRTPVFSDRITYLVLNPYWHVPTSIAVNDILPALKKNPNYLRENGFKLYEGWGTDANEIDASKITWAEVTKSGFKYRLRQDPGPRNALGRIKFMFPNEFNVYLHDTPTRDLFLKSSRDFSSGCVRIEKPLELAEMLLKSNSSWNMDRLRTSLQKGTEETVILTEKIPIHILYWTAWVADDGTTNFRKDLYSRDGAVLVALTEKAPTKINNKTQD